MGKKKEIGPYPPVEPISEIAKYLINQVSTNNYINSERKCIYLANFGLATQIFNFFYKIICAPILSNCETMCYEIRFYLYEI